MLKFIIKRLLSAIPVLLVILILVFSLMRMIPGNPMYSIQADANMTEEELEMLQEKYGLNGSIVDQFFAYMKRVVQGDWGTSYFNGKPVFENIFDRMEPTILITIVATLIALILGVPIGIYAATHHNSKLDYILSSTSMLFTIVPSFCFGVGLLYLFAFKLQWFPLYGYEYIEKVGLWGSLRYTFLPSLAIGLSGMAGYARHTRSQMLDVLNSDYIRTARAKGLADRRVYYRHALRNVMSFMITMVSGTITVNLGGATVLEKVFNIQGVGLLSYSSLFGKDYPQEQAILFFFATIFVFVNILLDIVYKLLDPRVELD
ncbi:MAG: ABC transporter permease [Lachnospiraceae bacterium]|nr:ABC transporter permease [Lachnospiraceae bacterium]